MSPASPASPVDPVEAAEAVAADLATAAGRLSELDGVPVPDHVGRYDEVHTMLQDALASIDGV